MDSNMTGPEARALRKIMRLTQAQLAVAMGVSERTIARWERHDTIPQTAATLMKLYATMAMKEEEQDEQGV